jgi:hypothetical protein
VTKDRRDFEHWFLNLNSDYSSEELTQIRASGMYFYTTTQALFDQFCRISELEAMLSFLGSNDSINDSSIDQDISELLKK